MEEQTSTDVMDEQLSDSEMPGYSSSFVTLSTAIITDESETEEPTVDGDDTQEQEESCFDIEILNNGYLIETESAKIIELGEDWGILELTHEKLGGTVKINFVRNKVFIEGAGIDKEENLESRLTPLKDRNWCCRARKIVNETMKVVNNVSVQYTAVMMYIGKRPSKKVRKPKVYDASYGLRTPALTFAPSPRKSPKPDNTETYEGLKIMRGGKAIEIETAKIYKIKPYDGILEFTHEKLDGQIKIHFIAQAVVENERYMAGAGNLVTQLSHQMDEQVGCIAYRLPEKQTIKRVDSEDVEYRASVVWIGEKPFELSMSGKEKKVMRQQMERSQRGGFNRNRPNTSSYGQNPSSYDRNPRPSGQNRSRGKRIREGRPPISCPGYFSNKTTSPKRPNYDRRPNVDRRPNYNQRSNYNQNNTYDDNGGFNHYQQDFRPYDNYGGYNHYQQDAQPYKRKPATYPSQKFKAWGGESSGDCGNDYFPEDM